MAQAKCPRCDNSFQIDETTLDAMRMVTCPNCSSSFQLPASDGAGAGAQAADDEFNDFFEVEGDKAPKEQPKPEEPAEPIAPSKVGQDEKWDTSHWGEPGDQWYPNVYEFNQDPFC